MHERGISVINEPRAFPPCASAATGPQAPAETWNTNKGSLDNLPDEIKDLWPLC